MEVLAVATGGVPSFYGEASSVGAIEAGQPADLVLLDANPASDIRNTKRIRAVSVGGRWLDRPELDRLLTNVERNARAGCHAGTAK
jgi:imidazolonepropionase-like amidohydrolase